VDGKVEITTPRGNSVSSYHIIHPIVSSSADIDERKKREIFADEKTWVLT
jgi:hypothetical protein